MIRGVIKNNYNLSHLLWFKVGGDADIFFKPEDIEDLCEFLKENSAKKPVTVIGAGSNMIVRDGGVDGVVIKLARNFTDIEILPDGNLSVGAGGLNFNLAKFAHANSFKGFEFLVGIPGTIGGGIAMNAGAYGSEFKDIVISVECVDKFGNICNIKNSDIGFVYRGNSLQKDLIFTKVVFKTEIGSPDLIKSNMDEISKKRSETQPVKEKTGGSTFANPLNYKAWELIDKAGLRGVKIGGAMMSEKHCNFMINTGNATAKHMEDLGELVRTKVKENFNIELKWEIKRIGRDAKI